ncbi:hypothetical protein CYK25_008780 [Varibaculum cambriense]|nr:hypothetical protein CYK25_008780 [Varibaculum cambriense]
MSKNKQDESFNLLYQRCSSLIDLSKRSQNSIECLEYDLREFRDDLRRFKESGENLHNFGLPMSLMFLESRAIKLLKTTKAIKKNVVVLQETYDRLEGLCDEQD